MNLREVDDFLIDEVKDVAKLVERLFVIIFGFTVLFIGIALLVLPGPAFVVIPIGLFILAGQFVWARRLLKKIKEQGKRLKRSKK